MVVQGGGHWNRFPVVVVLGSRLLPWRGRDSGCRVDQEQVGGDSRDGEDVEGDVETVGVE